MLKIRHRINTVCQLRQTSVEFGVEIDIRSGVDGRLYLHHDPFHLGEDFASWLAHYKHQTLIVNVKEEGLEEEVIRLLDEFSVADYFFLDQSAPFLVKWAKSGLRNSAVRVSEYEGLHLAHSLAGLCNWVWLDCFTRFPVSRNELLDLVDRGYKTCVVSPELQGRFGGLDVFMEELHKLDVKLDAVCTKCPELWT